MGWGQLWKVLALYSVPGYLCTNTTATVVKYCSDSVIQCGCRETIPLYFTLYYSVILYLYCHFMVIFKKPGVAGAVLHNVTS